MPSQTGAEPCLQLGSTCGVVRAWAFHAWNFARRARAEAATIICTGVGCANLLFHHISSPYWGWPNHFGFKKNSSPRNEAKFGPPVGVADLLWLMLLQISGVSRRKVTVMTIMRVWPRCSTQKQTKPHQGKELNIQDRWRSSALHTQVCWLLATSVGPMKHSHIASQAQQAGLQQYDMFWVNLNNPSASSMMQQILQTNHQQMNCITATLCSTLIWAYTTSICNVTHRSSIVSHETAPDTRKHGWQRKWTHSWPYQHSAPLNLLKACLQASLADAQIAVKVHSHSSHWWSSSNDLRRHGHHLQSNVFSCFLNL